MIYLHNTHHSNLTDPPKHLFLASGHNIPLRYHFSNNLLLLPLSLPPIPLPYKIVEYIVVPN